MLDITALLRQRSSCRDFSDQILEESVLNEILDDAMQSPSWSNTQPYRIGIVQGSACKNLGQELKAKFNRISELQRAPKWRQILAYLTSKDMPDNDYKQVPIYPKELQKRRLNTAKGLYGLLGIEREDVSKRDQQMARNFEFFGAPTALFIFTHKGLGVYSVLDAGILLQSIMLAAESRGVASCAQGALALWRKPLEKHFEIPKDYKLLCGLSLGYATDSKVNNFRPGRLKKEKLIL